MSDQPISGVAIIEAWPEKHRQRMAQSMSDRIQHAMNGDFRQAPNAYDALANLGLMERTSNGFKAIDPRQFRTRCIEALAMLAPYLIQDS